MATESMIMKDGSRYAGILMHPTSFYGEHGIGDLGKPAYEFIDFLEKSGQKVWQVLPLGQTGYNDSPYQSFSSFAGQPLIISIDDFIDLGIIKVKDVKIKKWDAERVDYGAVIPYKTALLKKAYHNFSMKESSNQNDKLKEIQHQFKQFCVDESEWLDDYALFLAIKDEQDGISWFEWKETLRFPSSETKSELSIQLSDTITYYKFLQFFFFRQWLALKKYANNKGIMIIGDIPIFVAPDSADTWANKELFLLDDKGFPTVVAGVPPDYFSATGQLWGNPLYNWAEHKKDNYAWWIKRIKGQLKLVDYLRIDHFRGFEAFWAVPYGQETAIHGEWRKGPSADLFHAIYQALGSNLPIIAEDLGLITPEVIKLRDDFKLPGMKVLQFAFDDLKSNDFIPYSYDTSNCICYSGTHDNDTTVGWYKKAPELTRWFVNHYMNTDGTNISWDFMRTAYSSIAKCAIIPMQDILRLDSECRMNTPGIPAGNWEWRIKETALKESLCDRLLDMTKVFGR